MTRTAAARQTTDATLHLFRFNLSWKGRKGEVVLIATGCDDADEFFAANAKALSGFPRSALVNRDYLGKETPEDRAAKAELSPVAAELVRIARGF